MNIDNDFLEEVGLGGMTEEQKSAFIAHTQEELETRIGTKMSEGLSEEQLDEFEKLSQKDEEYLKSLVSGMTIDFRDDPLYQKLLQKHNLAEGNWNILTEYFQIKWIEQNRPDYREIVKNTYDELKQEIIDHKDEILN